VGRRRRAGEAARPISTVPVPEPHEVPEAGGSLYVPPPQRPGKRKP
jgi:hypothetical protein